VPDNKYVNVGLNIKFTYIYHIRLISDFPHILENIRCNYLNKCILDKNNYNLNCKLSGDPDNRRSFWDDTPDEPFEVISETSFC
jgi:hypothetical protein